MKAQEVALLGLLAGPRQFVIPVFQRDYSWTEAQCQQLLDDVARVAKAPDGVIHFMGSIVYVSDENLDAILPQWMVIDGQQRLTSCTLLLIAIRDRLRKLEDGVPVQDSPRALDEQFLQNPYAPTPSQRAKLALRGSDNTWLEYALLGSGKKPPLEASNRVAENLAYFNEAIEGKDALELLRGIRRLMVVSVALKAGQDNPQLIFESLNSTGLSLTQADLVRNYVLMGHAEPQQSQWYAEYWRPLEMAFGSRYRDLFDNFLRDFLSVEFRLVRPLKLDAVYREFRHWYPNHLNKPEHRPEAIARLQRLLRHGEHYCRYMIGPAGSQSLEAVVARLRELVDVAAPLAMVLFDCEVHEGTLGEGELAEALTLVESYVFRRSVVGAESRSMGTTFITLAFRIKRDRPLTSLKAQLARLGRGREFPTDDAFRTALASTDMYHRRSAFYMLARLTNAGKEKVDLQNLTIEHILPQKKKLGKEWREMLGEDWEQVQATWLHRLGNLTLTAFNSEFQAKPFDQKKAREPGGYAHSPVWLNKSVAQCSTWGAEQIRRRGDVLARRALDIWGPLQADPRAIKEADLDDALLDAKGMSVGSVPCSNLARPRFDALSAFARSLSAEVLELPRAKSVVYRAPSWFAELIPRASRVSLRVMLDPAEGADISDALTLASEWEFIVNSTVEGGSIFSVRTDSDVEVAKKLVARAFELALEDDS
jgi:hypothetical protein